MKGSVEPSVQVANALSLLAMSVPRTLTLASEPTTVVPLVRLVCVLHSLAVPAPPAIVPEECGGLESMTITAER